MRKVDDNPKEQTNKNTSPSLVNVVELHYKKIT